MGASIPKMQKYSTGGYLPKFPPPQKYSTNSIDEIELRREVEAVLLADWDRRFQEKHGKQLSDSV